MGLKKSEIRNIVFDIGGVLIDLARERAVEALARAGVQNTDTLLGQYRQEGLFLDLECGRVSAAGFFDELRRRVVPGHPQPTDKELESAFCEFLVGLPKERLARLRALRKAGYKLYALSNTNAVMSDAAFPALFGSEGLRIADYFDGIVYSFSEGVCKPDAEIFDRVLGRYGLEPSESLMLDDSEANCEAARSLGMKALRIGSDEAPDMLAATEMFLK